MVGWNSEGLEYLGIINAIMDKMATVSMIRTLVFVFIIHTLIICWTNDVDKKIRPTEAAALS
ncbi:hypothetical protein DP73_15410 [Desulfosporosinus sp. HMP52]|nr:hypothetical protein DP73_15410 [Desulfosporosinus sp. HMP52]